MIALAYARSGLWSPGVAGELNCSAAISRYQAVARTLILQPALFLLVLVLPSGARAQHLHYEEQLLFDSANKERIAQHLHPLKWDAALADAARRHAALMAERKRLEHRLPDEPALDQRAAQAGARFSKIGENIAIGRQASTIHTGWMHSPGHRANILEAHFTALGVGVVEEDGELYAVQDFSTAVASLSRTPSTGTRP